MNAHNSTQKQQLLQNKERERQYMHQQVGGVVIRLCLWWRSDTFMFITWGMFSVKSYYVIYAIVCNILLHICT